MAMNMDALLRITARVDGANAIQAFSRDLKGLDGAAKLSAKDLGVMQFAINKMAREAGNTTTGLRQHLSALQTLRDRVEIGGKAYNRLGVEIDQLRGKLRALDGEAKKVSANKGLSGAGGLGGLGGVASLAAGAGGLAVGQQAIQATIQREESTRRLSALSAAFGEVTQAQDAAARAAQRFGLSQTEANQSFSQIYARLRPIGISLSEIEVAFNGFNTAARLSGASTQEASNAWLQLSQALGSGVLRGEELNSIFEQTPTIVQAIAREMNAPIGQVRKLAEQGKITSDIVIRALSNISTQGAGQLESAMKGPAQQVKNLQNAFENLQTEAAGTVLPAVIAGVQGLTAAIQASTTFLQDLKAGFGQVANAASPITGMVTGIAGAVDGLVGSFARLGVSEGFKMFLNMATGGLSSVLTNIADIGSQKRQQSQQRLQSAGVASTYTDYAGNVYDTATGRLVRSRPQPPTARPAPSAAAALAGSRTPSSGGGGRSFEPSSRAKALIKAAQELGVSPLDLATFISFETGGTFSPSKRGGAGNNYMGLIQFGPDERKAYGASPNQSFEEQVTGPVVRFFKDRFAKVGMSTQGADLLTLYRTVLGGNPKASLTAKDSFGTSPLSGVARMGPHRQKALNTFFGGSMANVGYGASELAADRNAAFDQQAAAAEKTRASQVQLNNARETFELDTRILEARMQENQQLTLARTAQKELAGIRQQAADVLSNKELPAAAQKAELDKLAVQAASVSRQLYFDISELESKRAATAQQAINKLIDEQELLYAKAAGVEEEVLLRQQLRDLTVGMTDAERARYAIILEQNKALKEQYGMSFGGGIRDGLKGYVESVGTAREATAQLTQTGIKGLEDALFSLVTTGTANFQEFAASILRDTARMILQLTIQRIIMQILGAINPAPAAGLNFADMAKYSAPLPGFAKGGAFGKNGIVPFAYGGIVNKPTLFQFANGGTAATGLLGEAGPEAILPLRRGPSGRLGVETSGAASSMNVTVNVDASGTKAEGDGGRAEQLGRVVSQAVQAELIKQKRPGGLLA